MRLVHITILLGGVDETILTRWELRLLRSQQVVLGFNKASKLIYIPASALAALVSSTLSYDRAHPLQDHASNA